MKKLIVALSLLAGLQQAAHAQISVNINIGAQPVWGPVGYDYAEYYYLPDLGCYYDIPRREWVYFDRGRWITTATAPVRFGNYDLYRVHKVVINEPRPWLKDQFYRQKYGSWKGKYDQVAIRDSREPKYYVVKGHPYYGKGDNHPGRGNGKGHGKDHGNGNGHGPDHGNGHGHGKGHGKGH